MVHSNGERTVAHKKRGRYLRRLFPFVMLACIGVSNATDLRTIRTPVIQAGDWTINSISGTATTPTAPVYTSIGDIYENKTAQVTPIRELRVTESTRLIGTVYKNDIFDTNFYSSSTTNGGRVFVSSGVVNIQASSAATTANGVGDFFSKDRARFVASNANEFRAIVRIEADSPAIGSNDRRWGLCDGTGQDGLFFAYKDGGFYVGYREKGIDTLVSTANFSGAVPTINSNYNRYQIIYSNFSAMWYVNDVLVHKQTATTSPLTDTLEFVIRACNTNSGGEIADHVMQIRVMSAVRLGQYLTQPTYKNLNTAGTYTIKFSAGILHNISLNTTGGPATSVTLYDSTGSATMPIAVIDTNRTGVSGLNYDLPFGNGLTAVGSGAFGDITIVYE